MKLGIGHQLDSMGSKVSCSSYYRMLVTSAFVGSSGKKPDCASVNL